MLRKIRKSKLTKGIAVYCALNLMVDIFNPIAAYALTGGPSQPEVESFEPIGTSEMVNLFTGDFTYNIPLMDVGGYPINMNYNSGITMDQEASWVGLGWNLNTGAITRQLRGIPDDFNGDMIVKEMNMKPNETYSASGSISTEIFGNENASLGFTLGISYNNYNGVGVSTAITPSFGFGESGAPFMTAGLGIQSGPDGLSLSPSVSFDAKVKETADRAGGIGVGASTSFSSRAGLTGLTLSTSVKNMDKETVTKKNKDGKETTTNEFKTSASAGGGSSISLGGATYVPSISMPMHSLSISVRATPGGVELFGTQTGFSIGGSYSNNRLKNKVQVKRAYGYNYNHNAQNGQHALMDFNREKDLPYSRRVPALALTNSTYDMYNITGQGVAGTYRSYRNDAGYVYDARATSESSSNSFGVEIGTGNALHSGFDFMLNDVNSVSGKWTNYNLAANTIKYSATGPNNEVDYEPFFYKQTGEKNVDSDGSFATKIHGDKPIRIDIESAGGFISKTNGKYASQNSYLGDLGAIATPIRDSRQRRTLSISRLSTDEAEDVGLQKTIYASLPTEGHHTAEFTVTKTDGSRYVYGLPLYNTRQEEVTFNASGQIINCATGLVPYSSGDATNNNSRGQDNFYSNTITPPYAHSYMLTAVLSSDYVDITANGPTEDDLGTYTLFEYTDAGIATYNWRTPYQQDQAYYAEGYRSLKGNNGDDRGSFVYGQKEIRYLNKIRTKTHVAVFTTTARKDAYEVIDRDGGRGTDSFHKLDQIDLYAAPDYNANGGSAIPIKTVHFEYDYSLCPNVPNNDGTNSGMGDINENKGKLTLTKVYFTYQNSNKGMLSPYTFTYDMVNNPDYDIKAYDRWGYYKPNTATSCTDLNNSEFPYVDQSTSRANHDNYAKSWNLNKITLPSGGEIDVEYEADDYAFIQDRRAYQMFKIKGIGAALGNTLSSTSDGRRIYFDATGAATKQDVYDMFLKDIMEKDKGYLYFNFLVDIKNSGVNEEFVRGYCQISDYNISGSNGWIEVSAISGDNPISKAAWQFGRLNIPRVIYNQPATGSNVLNTIIGLATVGTTMVSQVKEMFEGPDGYFRNKNYGEDITVAKSWIRLMNPDSKKVGGGSRVKKITMNDAWDDMTTEGVSEYGQEYYYDETGDGTGASSGVAAYEPQIGGDENALKQPIFYGGPAKALAPDDKHYVETPFGESYYPGATVGYSKVTVKNLDRTSINVTRHATGKTVHEFYTAKDFPVKARRTILEAIPQKSNPIGQALSFDVKDYVTASQGYVIELNDMHGKPKSQAVYAEGKTDKLSSITYHYLQDGNELTNEVTVINDDGTIETAEVGVEYDMVADFREQTAYTNSVGAQINLEGFIAGVLPIVVPPIWPNFKSHTQRFRSAVNTKVVSRYGILAKTVATDLGSTVETKNLAYDTESGEVLLTETINDYNDPVYNFTYPAHWKYDGMGPAYKNIGLSIAVNIASGTGEVTANNGSLDISDYLVKGDEILMGTTKYWVWDDVLTDNKVYLINSSGLVYSTLATNVTIKVIRSGRRNLQTTPIGTIASLRDPLSNGGSPYKNTNNQNAILYASNTATISPNDWELLNTGVTEFSEEWRSYVSRDGECSPYIAVGQTVNPYQIGLRGNWRAQTAHLYLGDREQRNNGIIDNNLDIRNDGIYETFSPFWTAPTVAGNKWGTDNSSWQWTTQVTDYSPNGNELENWDPLSRYSSAVFGYRNKLPLWIAQNAQRQDVAYDGFEDYNFKGLDCKNDHFDFYGLSLVRSTTEFHSGNYSAKVNGGFAVTKTVQLTHATISITGDAVPYVFKQQDELKLFSPITYSDKHLHVSFWVKEELSLNPEDYNNLTSYSNDITIDLIAGSVLTKSNIKKSDIIDGWQKIEYDCTIPMSTSGSFSVKLIANSTNNTYFDDVRIQPVKSSMKSYVYNDVTFRLMAELDENNYATFYEYDKEGALTRIKKETARGIVTIQESRNSKYKNP